MSIKIFFCYAHEDEALLKKLKNHLQPLQRQGLIDTWHDRDISAGTEWKSQINQHLNTANIILLLISSDFMASDYCYETEMKQALERHERKEARVIPVILRPVYWQAVLGHLQALPKDGIPIVNQTWHSIDDALFDVAEGIRKITEEFSNMTICSCGYIYPKGSGFCIKCGIIILSATSQQHVNLLKQGVKVWNQWRKKHSEIELDLRGADLIGADLSYTDLSDANLSDANLSDANLSDAKLSYTDLSDANLRGTSLIGADLGDADLGDADLSNAKLSSANLDNANLDNANLSKADLRGANLSLASLRGANLSLADLRGANLSFARLSSAIVTQQQLDKANSLQGATMPNGSIHA